MANVQVFADKQTDKRQAKNSMPPIYQYGGIKNTNKNKQVHSYSST